MKIQDRALIAPDRKSRSALAILDAAMEAAEPEAALAGRVRDGHLTLDDRVIDLSSYRSVHIAAFGKAAGAMARAASRLLDVSGSIVIVPRGSPRFVRGRRFCVIEASHPVPDHSSVRAARALLKFVNARRESEFVLFLVSGGSSSLLCMPDSVELSDKAYTTGLLLQSGADISEVNCIRKHLSQIKGGRLVERMRCDAASLVMSDVPGDELSDIASAMTYCDKTTFGQAHDILKRYGLIPRLPESVLEHIRRGASGQIAETPKQSRIPNCIVATNSDCIEAMERRARQLSYKTVRLTVYGDIAGAAKKIAKTVRDNPGACVIFGGEVTVNVTGSGSGGRNQELALRLLAGLQDIGGRSVIATLATDGIDGNTPHAGVLTKRIDIDVPEAQALLRDNDSSSFFKKHGGLIRTGYTGTNLMDVGLVLP